MYRLHAMSIHWVWHLCYPLKMFWMNESKWSLKGDLKKWLVFPISNFNTNQYGNNSLHRFSWERKQISMHIRFKRFCFYICGNFNFYASSINEEIWIPTNRLKKLNKIRVPYKCKFIYRSSNISIKPDPDKKS